VVVCLALVALAFATFTGRANAQPPINSVINCMTITKAGVYVVDGPLTQSGLGDCLLIKAANVTLNLNHQTITGSGSGVGVHIEASAGNAFVEGAAATISGFADGIEIDGANAFAENFIANGNDDAGVYLNAAKQARVANFGVNGNTDGVRISQGTLNTLQNPDCADNRRYGIWLRGTTHNIIGTFNLHNNATAGIYAGCWNTGPQIQVCKPAVAPSSFNFIFAGHADGATEQYGVAIDLGDNNNRVVNNVSEFNTTDMFDANPGCGNNLWLANVFGVIPANDCIH
jgi:copper-binding protein NosD